MPGPRGLLPTRMHQSASSKASRGSPVSTMPWSSGKAQSSSSMATPLQRLLGLLDGDLEQLQDDRLVLAERLAGGDAGEDGVADLPRGAGDGDAQGRLAHAATFSFSMMASATSDVPTAVGSSRCGFMS